MSLCAICVEDSESPVCCVPCGHVYCHDCIERWKKSEGSVSKCPECRKTIQTVLTIYIKNDDQKDEVKQLLERLKTLQSTLTESNRKQKHLKQEVEKHKQSLLSQKEKHEQILNSLQEERELSSTYKDQLQICSKEKKTLQKQIQSSKKKEEKIRNNYELHMVQEKERIDTLKNKNEILRESLANSNLEIKKLKKTIYEQENENKQLREKVSIKLAETMTAFCEKLLDMIEWFAIRFAGLIILFDAIYLFDSYFDDQEFRLEIAIALMTILSLTEYYAPPTPRRQLVFLEVRGRPVKNHFFLHICSDQHYYISEWNHHLTRDPVFLQQFDAIFTCEKLKFDLKEKVKLFIENLKNYWKYN